MRPPLVGPPTPPAPLLTLGGRRVADVGDHKECYETYLAAGREIAARTIDDEIRSILEKAIADVEVQDNPTEQVRQTGARGSGARARAWS